MKSPRDEKSRVLMSCNPILVMSVLHFIFSDATTYWKESGCTKLSFFHYMIGNGLANVYIHNWIRMDPLLKPGMYTARYDYKLPGFTGCPNSSLCEFFYFQEQNLANMFLHWSVKWFLTWCFLWKTSFYWLVS